MAEEANIDPNAEASTPKQTRRSAKKVEEAPKRSVADTLAQFDAGIEHKKVWDEGLHFKRESHVAPPHMGRLVGNVPADRITTWVIDPRFDQGGTFGMYLDRGYRPVRTEEVSTNPYVDDKLYVSNFVDHPNDYVFRGGEILMIGFRDYQENRRKANANKSQERIKASVDKAANLDVEIEKNVF